MAIWYDAPVSPDALTVFSRKVPVPSANSLTAAFPIRYSTDSTFDFGRIVRKNRTAKYRALDGSVARSSRDRGSLDRVPLAPLSSSLSEGEYERLQREFARTGGTFKEALESAIYDDAEQLTSEIWNRIELAWGDVLSDGKLTINENGFNDEADYGMPANHAVAPSGGQWPDPDTSTPLTDLLAWSDVYNATNGSRPAQFLSALTCRRQLQRSKEIIDAVHGATAGRTRVTEAELIDLLASEGLPTPRNAYDTQLSVDGVDTRVLDENLVVLLPADLGELGHMQFGMTATALELLDAAKTDLSFQDGPGIVGIVDKGAEVPYRKTTFVDAIGQPILTDARKLMVAEVA